MSNYSKVAIVTGANGFVGTAVVKELLQNEYTVYAVVRNGKEVELPKNKNCIPIICSLEDLNSLIDKIPVNSASFFFHFACAGFIGALRSDAKMQLKNVEWSIDAIHIAKKLGCQRFIFSSSIAEDESVSVCKTDGSSPDGHYLYGCSKFATRLMLMVEGTNLGIDVLWCKLANGYGVGDKTLRMLNSTLIKGIKGESPKFTSGTQNYDFVYIEDAANAFRLIAEKGKRATEYVIGSGHPKELRKLLLEMKEAIAPNLDFDFGDVPFTGSNQPLSAFDISKTTLDTGFVPKISFAQGCCLTKSWLEQQDFINL